MTIASIAATALSNSTALAELLAGGSNGIYKNISPDAGTYPIVVYLVTNDYPKMHADNMLYAHEATVRVTVVTDDGDTTAIEDAVYDAMIAAGFMWSNSYDYSDADTMCRVIDFTITMLK